MSDTDIDASLKSALKEYSAKNYNPGNEVDYSSLNLMQKTEDGSKTVAEALTDAGASLVTTIDATGTED